MGEEIAKNYLYTNTILPNMYRMFIKVISVLLALFLVGTLTAAVMDYIEWTTFWIVLLCTAIFAFFLPRVWK